MTGAGRESGQSGAAGVRPAAVAGLFYPGDPAVLRETVDALLAGAPTTAPDAVLPKALIAPHAGYVYSGSTAAAAYTRLAPARDAIRRVVLLGPSHRVPFRGVALTRSHGYATPLGVVPVDREAMAGAASLPECGYLDDAHGPEHSLEVHLPFLQATLGNFSLAPLVVGDARPDAVQRVIEHLWGGAETLVVISTDLSHYHDYATACRIDRETTESIETRRQDIRPEQACGCRPLNGLLRLAAQHGLGVRTLALCNSGDTAGSRDRVVGYGAYAVT